jgi:WD40 repeat protein
MHTAPIRQVATNKDCSLVATGSEDKSVRLWRRTTEGLIAVRTLRPPIGPDNDGKVNAVAMAPDGSWLAVAGWNRTGGDHWVYVFRAATGEILTRLGRVPVIERLAVSKDGRYLAAAVREGQGVRVWELEDQEGAKWRVVLDSRKDRLIDAKGIAFDNSGALYAVAYDGKLRRYPPGFKSQPRAVVVKGGRLPYSVAVHPSGDQIAVGFADTTVVDIYDAQTFALRSQTAAAGPDLSNLNSVAWSSDGNRLYGGGTYFQNGMFMVREWSDKGNGAARNIEGSSDAILDLIPCSDGIIFSAGDPALGLIDASGARRFWRGSSGPDMRGTLRENFSSHLTGRAFGLGSETRANCPCSLISTTKALWNRQRHPPT